MVSAQRRSDCDSVVSAQRRPGDVSMYRRSADRDRICRREIPAATVCRFWSDTSRWWMKSNTRAWMSAWGAGRVKTRLQGLNCLRKRRWRGGLAAV